MLGLAVNGQQQGEEESGATSERRREVRIEPRPVRSQTQMRMAGGATVQRR